MHEQAHEVVAYVTKGNESLVKEEEHPKEKEKETQACKANANLCKNTDLLSARCCATPHAVRLGT